eukprot:TRINITY_DN85157_c0_g1_i1.p1 TRINITY_DN85157_c0_g1~~TRINITY_DN85157_c0_g1_i1.p1  ORF type:complete len:393 (-),score=104.81 TRINITY_DN85157_c0_g1_i1:1235-2341(-)
MDDLLQMDTATPSPAAAPAAAAVADLDPFAVSPAPAPATTAAAGGYVADPVPVAAAAPTSPIATTSLATDLDPFAAPAVSTKPDPAADPFGDPFGPVTTVAAPAASSTSAPVAASTPPATVAGASSAQDDDDWGDFNSFQTAAPTSPSATGTATAADSFDPLAASAPPAAPDPFTNLDALEQKTSGDNMISMGPVDEFDPVAQQWAKTGDVPPATSSSTPVADSDDFDPNSTAATSTATTVNNDPNDLLGIGSSAPVEEELDKKMIYVFHKGEKNCVGWYSDMKAGDIKEAVLCACDAIMDGGFVLREVQFTGDDESTAEPKEDGQIFEYEQFDKLKNGQTYIIEAAGEREDLKKITGDRFRRLKVQI